MVLFRKILNKGIAAIVGPLIDFYRRYSIYRPFIKGDKSRVKVGKRVSLMNTIINVSSGDVEIGDDTIFGHNCVLATGIHEFEGGKRKKLYYRDKFNREIPEVPTSGFDIRIGSGCWITTNVVIVGGVSIGDNVIIMSGAVVTKDVPSSSIVGGVPAKVIKDLKQAL